MSHSGLHITTPLIQKCLNKTQEEAFIFSASFSGRKTGVHSFEKPVSRYTHAPERLEQMPRLQNRTISNLSPNVVKPIVTIPTTARVYNWQLKEPVAVRQIEHLKIDKHFDRDTWAVPGRYRTSYEAHGQVPLTGDAMKFPASYN